MGMLASSGHRIVEKGPACVGRFKFHTGNETNLKVLFSRACVLIGKWWSFSLWGGVGIYKAALWNPKTHM